MKQKEINILQRADDFIAKHRIAFILIMISLVVGICIGSLATSSGIKAGYWEKSGYYYMTPSANIFTIGIETDLISCSGMAFQSDKYFNDIKIYQTNYGVNYGVEINLNGNKMGGCIFSK